VGKSNKKYGDGEREECGSESKMQLGVGSGGKRGDVEWVATFRVKKYEGKGEDGGLNDVL